MNKFITPAWAAKPTPSLCLEVQAKPGTVTGTINIGAKSSYVFGRNQQLVDIEINDHPSLSRQHAAICHGVPLVPSQYQGGAVIMDLSSANGTFLGPAPNQLTRCPPNQVQILKEGSCIRFGESPIIYVVRGLEVASGTVPLSEAEQKKATKEALGNLAVYSDSESEADKKRQNKGRKPSGETRTDKDYDEYGDGSRRRERHKSSSRHRRSSTSRRSRYRSQSNSFSRSRSRSLSYSPSPSWEKDSYRRSKGRRYSEERDSSPRGGARRRRREEGRRDDYSHSRSDRAGSNRKSSSRHRDRERSEKSSRRRESRDLSAGSSNPVNDPPATISKPQVPSEPQDPVQKARQKLMAAMAHVNAQKKQEEALANQKKKTLWGSKKTDPSAAKGAVGKWATSVNSLGDNARQAKFLQMMGAKGLGPPARSSSEENGGPKLYGKTQQEYEKDLEQQFSSGLMYNVSRSGLGST